MLFKGIAVFATHLTLSPMLATAIFVAAILAGHRYRKVWKTDGPRWQLWVFGMLAATGLVVLAFVPLDLG